MSWLSNLFPPAPERKLRRARRFLSDGAFRDTLDELEGVEGPEADAMRAQAARSLVSINLHEWRAQQAAGNRDEAREALQRAQKFGATLEDIESARAAGSWDTQFIGRARRPDASPAARPR
jgi:hypothetical protein